MCICDPGFLGASCNRLQEGTHAACPSSCSGHGHCLSVFPPHARAAVSADVSRVTALAGAEAAPAPAPAPTPSLFDRLLRRRGAVKLGGDTIVQVAETRDVSPRSTMVSPPRPSAAKRGVRQLKLAETERPVPTHRCLCEPGFGGADCLRLTFPPTCPSNCSGYGLCMSDPPDNVSSLPTHAGAHASYGVAYCHCHAGYTGDACHIRSAACPNDCSGHGTCHKPVSNGVVSPHCSCAKGYTGSDCSVGCPQLCTGNGVCSLNATGVGACTCDYGFEGATCAQARQCAGNCSGHGTCASGVCSCALGFSGADCQTDGRSHANTSSTCPSQCSGNGACTDGRCHCLEGFYGADCSHTTPGLRRARRHR